MISKEIQPHWYKIKGIWYKCITTENGDRYVNGEKQNDEVVGKSGKVQ
jgi:hypothetical protein